jgi:hypothetical protein
VIERRQGRPRFHGWRGRAVEEALADGLEDPDPSTFKSPPLPASCPLRPRPIALAPFPLPAEILHHPNTHSPPIPFKHRPLHWLGPQNNSWYPSRQDRRPSENSPTHAELSPLSLAPPPLLPTLPPFPSPVSPRPFLRHKPHLCTNPTP